MKEFEKIISRYMDKAYDARKDAAALEKTGKKSMLIPRDRLANPQFTRHLNEISTAAEQEDGSTVPFVMDILVRLPKKCSICHLNIQCLPGGSYSPFILPISTHVIRKSLFGGWMGICSPYFPRHSSPAGIACFLPKGALDKPFACTCTITMLHDGIPHYLYLITEFECGSPSRIPEEPSDAIAPFGIAFTADLTNPSAEANTGHDRAYYVSDLSPDNGTYSLYPICGNKADASDFSIQYKDKAFYPIYNDMPLGKIEKRGSSMYLFHDATSFPAPP